MECRTSIAIAGIAAAFLNAAVRDASADDYFKGRDITIFVGSTSGGPYDAYARMLAPGMFCTTKLGLPGMWRPQCRASIRA